VEPDKLRSDHRKGEVGVDTVFDQLKYYSQKAGDVVRQFALAGVGVIWIVHVSKIPQGGSLIGTPLLESLRWPGTAGRP